MLLGFKPKTLNWYVSTWRKRMKRFYNYWKEKSTLHKSSIDKYCLIKLKKYLNNQKSRYNLKQFIWLSELKQVLQRFGSTLSKNKI